MLTSIIYNLVNNNYYLQYNFKDLLKGWKAI